MYKKQTLKYFSHFVRRWFLHAPRTSKRLTKLPKYFPALKVSQVRPHIHQQIEMSHRVINKPAKILENNGFAHHPRSGAESPKVPLVPKNGAYNPPRRKERYLGAQKELEGVQLLVSKFAYSSSTFRKTKQLMVFATSEKVQKCQKYHHSAKIIVILSSISPVDLFSRGLPGSNY